MEDTYIFNQIIDNNNNSNNDEDDDEYGWRQKFLERKKKIQFIRRVCVRSRFNYTGDKLFFCVRVYHTYIQKKIIYWAVENVQQLAAWTLQQDTYGN